MAAEPKSDVNKAMADNGHPRRPDEGPRTEAEARKAGESPSPAGNEGAQTQGQVDKLKDSEKAEDPANEHKYDSQQGSGDSAAEAGTMPQEGTKPNQGEDNGTDDQSDNQE